MPTLYRNARLYAPSSPRATAFLVADGRIAWLGGEDDADDAADAADLSADAVRDLDGALVTPAFVDAHVHATSTGLALTGLDLRATASLGDALAALERTARAGRGRPVFGAGWDETRWPQRRPPTTAELDRAAYGGAVYLARVDVHSAVVSSVLRNAVPGLAALPGYDASGWLRGPAHEAVRIAALTALRPAQRSAAQRAALQRAAALGIAAVHEMGGPIISSEDDLAGLLRLAAEEPLPDVTGYWGELFGIEAARDLGAVGAGGDLFCDGSLGSHTAALSEPYSDRPATRGGLRHTTADLAEHIVRCTRAGLQAGFHAIGDAAVEQVLDAVDQAAARDPRARGAGHRIEHAEYVREPARLAASGLVASMQPCFDALWGGPRGMYAARLGTRRAAGLNRFADLAAAGVALAFGSDAPVTELGPWAAVRAAVAPHDTTAGLRPAVAFAAHTSAGWAAAGRADEPGILQAGAPATFAAWAADDLDDSGLPRLGPDHPLPTGLATVLRGQAIFDAGLLGA